MNELIYALLAGPMAAPAYYAIGWVCLALISLCMMIIDIARGRERRIWSTGLLLAGLAYAAANIGVFVVTISVDQFAIFELFYIIAVAFVGPALMMIALIFVARAYKRLGWPSVLGFAIWIGCVGLAHLFVIAAASASV